MTAHQDVAGLVAELRDTYPRDSGYAETANRAADRLESLSQALREAEERATVSFRCGVAHQDRANEMQDRAIAAESRLAEAMKVIEPFARYFDLNDCADRLNDDALEVPIRDLRAARAFIAGNGEEK